MVFANLYLFWTNCCYQHLNWNQFNLFSTLVFFVQNLHRFCVMIGFIKLSSKFLLSIRNFETKTFLKLKVL